MAEVENELGSTWVSERDTLSGQEIEDKPVFLGDHLKEGKLIGEFMKVVVDVTDLKKGLAFWSELTGLEPSYVDRAGRFMGLGNKMVLGENSSVILLQLVDEVQPGGGTHIDLKVHDVEEAIQRIIEIGGTLKREPGLHADLRPDGIDPLDGLALAEGMEMEAIVAIDTTSVADDVITYA